MKKFYFLTKTACALIGTGICGVGFSQISAVPTTPTGGTGPTTISSSTSTGTISTPITTVPTVKKPAKPTQTQVIPTPQVTTIRTPVPVVQKPDLNAILRQQAGNVQSLKGTNLNGKPDFRPNGGGRKPAVDPRPGLQIGRMQPLTVGKITLRPGATERVKYIRQTVTRPIGANDDAPKVEAQETQPIFNLDDSLSESAMTDLLITDSIKETSVEDLRENIGEFEIQDDIEINFSQDNNTVGDKAEDLIGGVLDLRDRGTLASFERNRQSFDFGFNAGVTGRLDGLIGRSGVLDDDQSEYGEVYGTAENGTVYTIFVLGNSMIDSGIDLDFLYATDIDGNPATWISEEEFASLGGSQEGFDEIAEQEAQAQRDAEEKERQRKEDEEEDNNREALGGNDDNGDSRFFDHSRFGGNQSGGSGTIRMGRGTNTGGGGPLVKPPSGGNSGSPTIRMDHEDVGKGMLNLVRLKALLEDGAIDFGEDGDPRDNPNPSPGGEGAPPINGGNPGVVTKNAKAGLNFNGTGNALKINPANSLKVGSEIKLNVEIDPKGN